MLPNPVALTSTPVHGTFGPVLDHFPHPLQTATLARNVARSAETPVPDLPPLGDDMVFSPPGEQPQPSEAAFDLLAHFQHPSHSVLETMINRSLVWTSWTRKIVLAGPSSISAMCLP